MQKIPKSKKLTIFKILVKFFKLKTFKQNGFNSYYFLKYCCYLIKKNTLATLMAVEVKFFRLKKKKI